MQYTNIINTIMFVCLIIIIAWYNSIIIIFIHVYIRMYIIMSFVLIKVLMYFILIINNTLCNTVGSV